MGLINLKTNLKSLKYGKDRVGGGSSGQPFIQKPIPEDFSSVGQRYTSLVTARIDDASRLTQLLLSGKSVDGLLFTGKQNTLSRLGVKTQASPNNGLNENPYLPTSTIAQAAIQGSGYHLNKQGLNPYPGGTKSISYYSDVVKYNQDKKDNRLVSYLNTKINTSGSDNILTSYSGGPGSVAGVGTTYIYTSAFRTGVNNSGYIGVSGFRTVGIDNTQQPGNVVEPFRKWTWSGLTTLRTPYQNYDYVNVIPKGGLNANQRDSLTGNNWYTGSATWTKQWTSDTVFGNPYNWYNKGLTKEYFIQVGGSTQSRFSSYWNIQTGEKLWNPNVYQSGTLDQNTEIVSGGKPNKNTYTRQLDVENPYGQNYINISGSGTPDRVYISGSSTAVKSISTSSFDTSIAGVDYRVATSQLTGSNSFRAYLKNYTEESVEQKVYLGNPAKNRPTGSISYDQINALGVGETKEDLINFRISVIGGSTVQFRAFLDSFSDNFTAEWNTEQFTGRGEKFYTYSGYERKISLGWTIAAQSVEELRPMYQRLNYLASVVTPNYRSGFLRGNLIKLTVGNYVVGLPGKFDGLDIAIVDRSSWDIDNKMPVALKVSGFSFTPFHTFVPQIGQQYISFG